MLWYRVTGASSGIGRATARLLAASGAFVVLGARRGEALATIADEIDRRGTLYGVAAALPVFEQSTVGPRNQHRIDRRHQDPTRQGRVCRDQEQCGQSLKP